MLKVSRAICWQVGALVIAIVIGNRAFALPSDRQFYREVSQQRVMSWDVESRLLPAAFRRL